MNKPLVSIIIPVFNGGNYLQEAINSALAQTYSNIEVIVVNDGSQDGGITEKIAKSYDDKIRYFHKENGGVATALNLAIKEMEGEYFSWLSHDDMYYPNKIERQLEALWEKGDIETIIQSGYNLLNVNSNEITRVVQSETYPIAKLIDSVFPVLQGLVNGCSLLIHKSHFKRVGIFNEDLITSQDYDLWFRMMRYQKMIYVSEPLVLVRRHDDQGSNTLTCYDSERCKLHISFLESLSEEEMCSMYGNPYMFYHKMYCYFKGGNMSEAYHYVSQKFKDSDIPEKLTEQLSLFDTYIKNISRGKANRVCIFGAGEYGIRLYYELRSRLIPVAYFSDNNAEKWGYLFDNMYCISPRQLEEEKDSTLVIIATAMPDGIINQLKEKGFPYIALKQEMDDILLSVPPVKWITALDNIQDLDYSSKDVLFLINEFNQTIFDICKYYEDRIRNSR